MSEKNYMISGATIVGTIVIDGVEYENIKLVGNVNFKNGKINEGIIEVK